MVLDIYFRKVRREEIGYFRKVNFLIAFFEDYYEQEVQNCKDFYIEKVAVEELISRCKKVLADHTLAPDLLPTKAGFFFGSTEYDDYYYNQVQSVLDYCEKDLLPEFDRLGDNEEVNLLIWY